MSSLVRQIFFQPDPSQGSLRRASGQRLAAVPLDFLIGLHLHLYERFAEKSPDLLYRSGYEQALQDMLRLNEELRAQYGGESFDLWQMDAKFILDTWWEPLDEAGWGRCTFDLAALTRGIGFADIEAGAIAEALGNAEHPVCHFVAGLFAGAFSFFERTERHATELQCVASGGSTCRFLIGPGSVVDSAETWRQEGISAVEIARRLK